MILSDTRKVQAVLTASKTTNDMSIVVDYIDGKGDSKSSGMQVLSTNGTTAVDIAFSPDSQTSREITGIVVYNKDTAEKILQISVAEGVNTFPLVKTTLQVGDSIGYTAATGWYVMDSGGNRKNSATSVTNLTIVEAVEVDAGESGVAGTVDIFPPTAAKGKATISKADNTNDDVTTLRFDEHAQATTIHLGDLGAAADYVVRSTAQITLAEADRLDGAGTTVVASKAVIADADKDIVGVRKIWLGTNGVGGFAGELDIQDGANPGASAALTYADLVKIDAVTNGTVAADKAVVVDSNKDIGDFRNLDAVNLDAGASGTAGTVDVFPTTALKGKLAITKADNTNDDTTTLAVDLHGQATTVHIPDSGAAASYVVQSTAALTLAEADRLDGAVEANSVALKVALLDTNKRIQTNSNNGTPEAGVTAVHYGDGVNVTAVLTLTDVAITVGNSASLGVGALLYTLPTGAAMIRDAYMSVGISGVTTTTDTPDVGLGTVIASGVITTLDGTATFENIITGQTATDTNGTATVKSAGPTAGNPLEITTGGAHTVYFNAADGWGANADASGLLNGTVVVSYVRQAA